MTKLIRAGLVLIVSAVPVALEAQQRPAGQDRPTEAREAQQRAAPHSGVGMLLRHRSALGLTDVQIGRLEKIAKELERQNRPLLQRLRAAGIPVHGHVPAKAEKLTAAEEEDLRQRLEAHRPVLEQLRSNMRAAMVEAHGVLTSKQRDRLRAIMDSQQSRRSDAPEEEVYTPAKPPYYDHGD